MRAPSLISGSHDGTTIGQLGLSLQQHQGGCPYPHNGLYNAYYYFLQPVTILMSFLSSATILRRTLRNKPRGLFARNTADGQGRGHQQTSAQFFDALVSEKCFF